MYKQQKVAAIIVAAGKARRMGFDKMRAPINGRPVLWHTVQALQSHPYIDELVVVAGENINLVRQLLQGSVQKPWHLVEGGATRAASVAAGVAACPNAALVAIHDGARPFVPGAVITRAIEAGEAYGAAAPAVAVKDTIKSQNGGFVQQTPARHTLAAVQTPQVFNRKAYMQALQAVPMQEYESITDDCMVMERAGQPVFLVEGAEENRKITTPQDLQAAGKEEKDMRIGHGYDVHKLVEGRPLILGGVEIPYEKGLLGHSDADVLLHAVADSMLGGAALGDIGKHFPDSDPAYKGANSLVLLQKTAQLVRQNGWQVANIDATLLCQAPKLAPHIQQMRNNIANAVQAPVQAVSVKATTEEGLGFTGQGLGIAAHCVVLLQPVQNEA